MTFKLFDYQQAIYGQVLELFKTENVVCLAGGTGVGKTEIASQLILDNPNARFLVLAHGQGNLRTNFAERLEAKPALRSDVFTLASSSEAQDAFKARIVVSLPQTVHRCIDLLGNFDYIIVDEAHQFYSHDEDDTDSMYATILENHNGKRLLLTASHYELNNVPKVFFSREEALAVGRVEDVTIDIVETETKLTDEDFTESGEVKLSVKVEAAVGVINNYLSHEALPAIVALHSIEAANSLLSKLIDFGRSVTISDSVSDPMSENMNRFKAGEFDICLVVNRGQIGFDYPQLVTFIDASYSQNIPRLEQMIGRVARKHPDGNRKKRFIKLSPTNQLCEVSLIMTGVIALGVSDVYRTWNGKPSTLKLKIQKGLMSLRETLPTPKEKSKQGKKPPTHIRLSFQEYLGMHEAEELTLTSAQDYCKLVRGDKPWTASLTPKQLALWVAGQVNPKNVDDWKRKHPQSHDYMMSKGWRYDCYTALGIRSEEDNFRYCESYGEFTAWLLRTIQPESYEEWKETYPESYNFASRRGWLKRIKATLPSSKNRNSA